MNTPKQITLANLSDSTEQEVFDWVAYNLLKQNKQSRNKDGECLYRGPRGLKCAAGWCVTDKEYEHLVEHCQEGLEGTAWESVTPVSAHSELITQLQTLHDAHSSEKWLNELTRFAKENGFNVHWLQ